MPGRSFPSLKQLLAASGGRGPDGVKNKHLCHVVVDAAIKSWDSKPSFMPWVTPVIGTGTEEPRGLGAVKEIAEEAINSLSEASDRVVVKRFIESLLLTRLHHAERLPAVNDTSLPASKAGSLLGVAVLACASVTDAYHQIKSWNSQALTRERDDIAVLRTQEFPEWLTVRSQFVLPAIRALRLLEAPGMLDDAPGMSGIVSTLASGLAHERPTVLGSALLTLTEFCWDRLSASAPPGWSDLLWRLYIRTSVTDEDGDHAGWNANRGPRPLTGAQDEILEELQSELRRWWVDESADKELPVHDAVADLLAAQASYFVTKSPLPPPRPMAIVTSLDLELELRLIHNLRSSTKSAFWAAMPVTVSGEQAGRYFEFSWWVGLKVESVDGGRALLAPTSDAWVSLQPEGATIAEGALWMRKVVGNDPVIVHLAGCPRVAPPNPNVPGHLRTALLKALRAGPGGEEVKFDDIAQQAVVSEFSGIQLSLPKTRLQAVSDRGPDVLQSLLYPSSAQSGKEDYARFFLLLGVQAEDPAIRTRLAVEIAQLMPQSAGVGWKRHGLAVSQRMSGATEDLMTSLNLDVVKAPCADFVEEIAHLAAHIRTLDTKLLPPKSETKHACPLGWP